jgi:hypothetical protein
VRSNTLTACFPETLAPFTSAFHARAAAAAELVGCSGGGCRRRRGDSPIGDRTGSSPPLCFLFPFPLSFSAKPEPRQQQRTTPPRALSPACALPDGRARRRRVASRHCPQSARSTTAAASFPRADEAAAVVPFLRDGDVDGARNARWIRVGSTPSLFLPFLGLGLGILLSLSGSRSVIFFFSVIVDCSFSIRFKTDQHALFSFLSTRSMIYSLETTLLRYHC